MNRRLSLVATTAAVCLMPFLAHAADVVADAAATTPASLGEVVVTAQKVQQNLQKAPISVTTLDSSALDRAAISSAADLSASAPGLIATSNPATPLTITIRGAGFEGIRNDSSQPGVSLNQNGVYITSPFAATTTFLDIDQLEILRGPQGTVLGQNSDGGAINITTVRPKLGVYGGLLEGSYGSYNDDRVRLAVNLPVGDTFAMRAAFQQEKHDGDTVATNVPGQPNYQLGNENSYNGRLDLILPRKSGRG